METTKLATLVATSLLAVLSTDCLISNDQICETNGIHESSTSFKTARTCQQCKGPKFPTPQSGKN